MHKRGGELCYKINAQIKPTQDLYWFGLPDLRPVLNHPGRVPLYLQVLERVHLEPLQLQVFESGSLATLQPQVLHKAHLQPF